MDGRLKEATEDAERERALKDVVEATAKEKGEVAAAAEKRAANFEKAQALVE